MTVVASKVDAGARISPDLTVLGIVDDRGDEAVYLTVELAIQSETRPQLKSTVPV